MALSTPQYQDQRLIGRLRMINSYTFYVIAACSTLPIVEIYFPILKAYDTIIIVVNVVALIIYFALDFIVEYHLYPQAEDIRKADFIDNSWGSALSLENSERYFDNDEVQYGLYKMSVNLFQNAVFTLTVSKTMRRSKYGLNLFFALGVLVIACYGFNNVPVAIPLLQVVFSSVILGDLFKHMVLVNRVKQTVEKWQVLFQIDDFKDHPEKYVAQVYNTWLYYESTLARTQISFSEQKFNNLNQKLTRAWEQIKGKYHIS